MTMDFPTAWAIVNDTSPADHDPRCSFAQTSGAVLCDCHVLTSHPQYIADYGSRAASEEVVAMADTPPSVTVDIAADLTVIRPGDTVLVRMLGDTHPVQLKTVADRLRERLPDVDILLMAGVDGIEVYRPEAVGDVQRAT